MTDPFFLNSVQKELGEGLASSKIFDTSASDTSIAIVPTFSCPL